ncbi:MAG: hypothetical protein IKF19_04030 [Bacilli bacterium]|nr:hypothetical protein [Bacilli bacterium]
MNKKANNSSIKNNNTNKHSDAYTRFRRNFILYDLLLLIFIFAGIFLIRKSFNYIASQNITYKETSNLDYRVKLKQNDFYESETLNKGMLYIASLIDKVDVSFNYVFDVDRNSNIDFRYDIVGKLIITDKSDNNKVFFEKDYSILKDTKDVMNSNKEHQIREEVSIDYDYYNDLANKFRIKYGVETNSNLIVYLKINERNKNSNSFILNNNSAMSLTIPLSQRAVNISMDYKEINKTSKLVSDEKLEIVSYPYLVLGIVFLLIGIYFVYRYVRLLWKLRVKSSKYERYIKRILNEYDRLIVETMSPPVLKDREIIEVDKFQELLDVRDNLRLPIKYYVSIKNKQSIFYINHGEELYILVINDKDIN